MSSLKLIASKLICKIQMKMLKANESMNVKDQKAFRTAQGKFLFISPQFRRFYDFRNAVQFMQRIERQVFLSSAVRQFHLHPLYICR